MSAPDSTSGEGTSREKSRSPHPTMSEVRIVLLGKTGAGKSASGNTILERDCFVAHQSVQSVTETCEKQCEEVADRKITVIDTPGLFDTEKTVGEVKDEIEKCMELSDPGPHAFLLVIRLDVKFTEEEKNAVKWIQKNFGEGAAKFTMVLFTHADQLGDSAVEVCLRSRALSPLIKSFEGRHHVFNNKEKDRSQVHKLLEKIDSMVKANGGRYYTSDMFQETQKQLREKEKRERKEEERKREEQSRKIKKEKRKRKIVEKKLQEEKKTKKELAEKAEEEERMRRRAEKEREEAERDARAERRKKRAAEREAEEQREKKRDAKRAAEEERHKRQQAEKKAVEERRRRWEAEDKANEEKDERERQRRKK